MKAVVTVAVEFAVVIIACGIGLCLLNKLIDYFKFED
jgi:hypothetical protein